VEAAAGSGVSGARAGAPAGAGGEVEGSPPCETLGRPRGVCRRVGGEAMPGSLPPPPSPRIGASGIDWRRWEQETEPRVLAVQFSESRSPRAEGNRSISEEAEHSAPSVRSKGKGITAGGVQGLACAPCAPHFLPTH
jgi:hypothetical protein